MKKKKLWIVKIEIRADDPNEAILKRNKGMVYEVTLAEDRYQPEERQKDIFGFRSNK